MCFLVIKSCGYIFMALSASNIWYRKRILHLQGLIPGWHVFIFYAAKVFIDFKKAFPKFPLFDLPFYTNEKFKKRIVVFSVTGF